MKFEHTNPKDVRRRNAQVDRLAHKEQMAKRQGRIKTLKKEGLELCACCLFGLLYGACLYFQM